MSCTLHNSLSLTTWGVDNFTPCALSDIVGVGGMGGAGGSGLSIAASMGGVLAITVPSGMMGNLAPDKLPDDPPFPHVVPPDGSSTACTTVLLVPPRMVACATHPSQYYS